MSKIGPKSAPEKVEQTRTPTDRIGPIESISGTVFWTAKSQIPLADASKSCPQNRLGIQLGSRLKSTSGLPRSLHSPQVAPAAQKHRFLCLGRVIEQAFRSRSTWPLAKRIGFSQQREDAGQAEVCVFNHWVLPFQKAFSIWSSVHDNCSESSGRSLKSCNDCVTQQHCANADTGTASRCYYHNKNVCMI